MYALPPIPKPPTALRAPVVVEVAAVVLLVDITVVNVEPPAPPVTLSRPPENESPDPICVAVLRYPGMELPEPAILITPPMYAFLTTPIPPALVIDPVVDDVDYVALLVVITPANNELTKSTLRNELENIRPAPT